MRLLQDMKDISYNNVKQTKELSDEIKFIKIELGGRLDETYNNYYNLNQRCMVIDQAIGNTRKNYDIDMNGIKNDIDILKHTSIDQQNHHDNFCEETSKLLKETSHLNQNRLEQFAEQVDIYLDKIRTKITTFEDNNYNIYEDNRKYCRDTIDTMFKSVHENNEAIFDDIRSMQNKFISVEDIMNHQRKELVKVVSDLEISTHKK